MDEQTFDGETWQRGFDAATLILCGAIQAILEGKDDGRRPAKPPWEQTRQKLLALVNERNAVIRGCRVPDDSSEM